ncbi:MAG: aspartate kinase [Candidatus Peregrinibacteria bacterium]|nr:aspartate kinase [Candidatus Peregrinibacteria bacterium]
MKTVSHSIGEILSHSPFLAEALSQGIINYSALARQLKPELEKVHLKTFTEGAIVMALKRLERATPAQRSKVHVAATVRNITVRSNLVEHAFRNSERFIKVHEKLLALAEKEEDVFVHVARGVFETAIVVSASLEDKLTELTRGEHLIRRFTKLSSISIRFHPDTANIPGIYYPFFQALAWHGINFIEIVSGFSELTFLCENAVVDRAFAVIKGLTSLRPSARLGATVGEIG